MNQRQSLSDIGRFCYGISIAVLGILTFYYDAFPYMLMPSEMLWLRALKGVTYSFGVLLILAGAFIALGKKKTPAGVLLGGLLLLVFGLYLVASRQYRQVGDWENAAKVLALAGGAFVVAGGRWKRFGAVVYALTIISFSIDHFLYAHEAADYVPSWIPGHVFWLYTTGAALLCAGVAIAINIKTKLAATLLGAMILTWFVILHIPRIIASPHAGLNGEIASAMLALAYGGIAWVVAGTAASAAKATGNRKSAKG